MQSIKQEPNTYRRHSCVPRMLLPPQVPFGQVSLAHLPAWG